MAKKITVKFKKSKKDEMTEKIMNSFHRAADELSVIVNKAKKQYKKMDKKTSQKLLTGVLGATMLVAGAIGLKKLQNKKKK